MTRNPYNILGVGCPFVDHIMHVPEEFLSNISGSKGGMVPVSHETLRAILQKSITPPVMVAGGSCANTIRGLAQLGHRCALVGKIGSDLAGKMFIEKLQTLNISTSRLLPTKTPTAQAVCLITPDGERTMRSFLGAGQEMSADDLKPELFSGVSLVHIEGYTLLNGSLAEKAMQLAKDAKAKVSFDLGSFEVVEKNKKRLVNLLSQYVDIVFANKHEVHSLMQLNPEQGCTALTDICETAVVLMGDQGCWAGQGTEKIHTPAFPVSVVDTTGAGDLFASGFLHGVLEKKSLADCSRYGALTGATVVQVQGVEIPPESWEEIRNEFNAKR